jgi:LmbE family N-acetylglucosaminyl deacetylase
MRVLFVGPHPDDIEFACAGTCQEAVRLGWDVHELLMTSDEYGTPRNEFKGRRIKRIRMHEMAEAAKVYGMAPDGSLKIRLHWFGEIDGHLPFTRAVLGRLEAVIREIDPDVIFGPDSFFTMDYHPDHMRTGWLLYLAVKDLPAGHRPLLFLYHSTKNDFFLPITGLGIQVAAWSKHRSQTTPLNNKVLGRARTLFYAWRLRKTAGCLAEGFRRATFAPGENAHHGLGQAIFHSLFYRLNRGFPPEYYMPDPASLGLIDK